MGNNVAGTGDGDSWEKKHAGMGGSGVSVDFAGRGWGHITVPMQLSTCEPCVIVKYVYKNITQKSNATNTIFYPKFF